MPGLAKSRPKVKCASIFDSPGLGDEFNIDSLQLDLLATPVSPVSSDDVFGDIAIDVKSSEPVSPPKIKRTTRVGGSAFTSTPVTVSFDPVKSTFASPKPKTLESGKDDVITPGTQATSMQSYSSPTKEKEKNELSTGAWGKNSILRKQIKHLKKALPKVMKSLTHGAHKKKSATDLADLTVATLCLVPRNGAGMNSGRLSFERMRTSLTLHMIQHNKNIMWGNPYLKESDDDKKGSSEKGHFAKLYTSLNDSIADNKTSFVQKSQEVVMKSKDTLEEVKGERNDYPLAKYELGHRNITCIRFLSGMYREVVKFYESEGGDGNNIVPSHDGMSLMVVAAAYYALGKFDSAISVYQMAGLKLKKKISTNPEYIVHCAKLFNNMGCVYYEMKNYKKAMTTFQRALALFHDDGEDNYATWVAAIMDQASIMNNMAYTLIKFKQFDDASDLVDASFELQQILPDNNNMTMTISTLSSMAFIYYRSKQYGQAFDTYSACLQLQRKSKLYTDNDRVDILYKMSDICKKMKNHEMRIHILRTILEYQTHFLTEDDDELWETNAALAEALQLFAENGGDRI